MSKEFDIKFARKIANLGRRGARMTVVIHQACDEIESLRAMLERIGNLPGQDAFHKQLVREALHSTQPAEGSDK